MAASKEAIALVLDVGQNMNAPANEKNDTYLDLALDSLQWIVSRKIFTEAKDEIALILFGSEETNNPLAEDDQYQNISIARELQLPDFDFIKFIQNEIRTTEKEGDWLDALVIAMEALKEGTEGKKIGMQSITLFSNLGGDFSEDQMGPIAKCLLDNQIELNIIGPSVNLSKSWADHHISVSQQNSQAANGGGAAGTSNDNSGNDSQEQYSKKTDTMKHGEEVVRKLYACGLEGECYTPGEALRMLSSFQKRNVRPMPWKVQLEIGENTQIPVCLYLRTKGNKLKQTWRKMDPTNPNSDVGMDRTYIRVRPDDNVPVTTNGAAGKFSGTSTVAKKNDGGAGTEEGGLLDLPTEDKIQVDKEELVKGYKFGTTIVPFSEADLEAMKYKGEGKCFQLIGFADKHRVRRHEYVGDGVHYVLGDPADDAACVAVSALVKALRIKNKVGIVRYCYNVRGSPRIGMIMPSTDEEGSDVLIWVLLPFEEEYRWYTFPDFNEPGNEWSEPSDTQLNLVDDLIDSMDLSKAKVDTDGNRLEALNPEEVINPQHQYIFECLRHRALYPEQPLPQPDAALLSQVEPLPELKLLAEPVLKRMKTEFKLERVQQESKRDTRTAVEVFQKGGTVAPGPSDVATVNGAVVSDFASPVKTKVGTVDPIKDFKEIILQDDGKFANASDQLAVIIRQFVFTGLGSQFYEKALDTLEEWRKWSVQFQNTKPFNDFLKAIKEELIAKNRKEFWDRILKRKVELISKEECGDSDISKTDVDMLMSQNQPEPVNQSVEEVKDDSDLLDELE